MKLNCNINGTSVSLIVNSDKPLSFILRDLIATFPDNSQCLGGSCGNCIVLLNGTAVLSCLIPAFSLNGCSIMTFDGFRKTRSFHDIEKAYTDIGNQPCPQCFASKTLLIESLLLRMDKENQANSRNKFTMQVSSSRVNEQAAKSRAGGGAFDSQVVAQEFSMCKCHCIELSELERIINLAYKYRSRRRARRS